MLSSNRGFTLFEIVTVMMLIGVVSLVGTSMAKQYKLASEARYANQDLLVIQRGLRDRWLTGTPCASTMPAGLPTTSPYGTAYNVNCYQQGFGVAVDLPTEIAQGPGPAKLETDRSFRDYYQTISIRSCAIYFRRRLFQQVCLHIVLTEGSPCWS